MGINHVAIRGTDIEIVSLVKSLGVVLDSKMKWKEHVFYIRKRANNLLYRLHHFMLSNTLALRKHLVMSMLFR